MTQPTAAFPGTGNASHQQPTQDENELSQHRLEPQAPDGTGAGPGAASAGASRLRCVRCEGWGLWLCDICPECGGYGYVR